MSADLKQHLTEATKRLRAIESHRDRLKGLTPDRWLEARHHAAQLEVRRLTAQVAAIRTGFTFDKAQA